ncbi:unnamed protein product, partial [Prorocentrum cordatum]
ALVRAADARVAARKRPRALEARVWAAASARTLARRLRRERRSALGDTRAGALAHRLKFLRVALVEHWAIDDRMGCHFPSMGETVVAARLLGWPPEEVKYYVEVLEAGNWSRHAPPPSVAGPPRPPDAPLAAALEGLLDGRSTPLRAKATVFLPHCDVAKGEVADLAEVGAVLEFDGSVEVGPLLAFGGKEVDVHDSGASVVGNACADRGVFVEMGSELEFDAVGVEVGSERVSFDGLSGELAGIAVHMTVESHQQEQEGVAVMVPLTLKPFLLAVVVSSVCGAPTVNVAGSEPVFDEVVEVGSEQMFGDEGCHVMSDDGGFPGAVPADRVCEDVACPRFDAEQFLVKLFSHRHAAVNSNHAEGELEVGLADVGVSMEDVVRQLEYEDVDPDLMHTFMLSHRFRQCFRVQGVSLFRVFGGRTGLSETAEARGGPSAL